MNAEVSVKEKLLQADPNEKNPIKLPSSALNYYQVVPLKIISALLDVQYYESYHIYQCESACIK